MFDNIGGKIKFLAIIICILGIIASIAYGCSIIILRGTSSLLLGLVIIIGGSILSWISVFMTYGFGQLIENSDIIAEQSSRANAKYEQTELKRREKELKTKNKKAKESLQNDSFSEDDFIDIECPHCKEQLSFIKQAFIDNELVCPICDTKIDVEKIND